MDSKRPGDLFDELLAIQDAKSLPPVTAWHPEREGRIDIRIDRDGGWHHEGRPIRRLAMVKLFSSILRKDADGYCLVTPAERLVIEVEEVPFMAVELTTKGHGRSAELLFRTNVDDHVVVDQDHPLWVPTDEADEPRPYLRVRDALDARLTRAVFYHLVEQSSMEDGQCWAYSRGQRFLLGRIDDSDGA